MNTKVKVGIAAAIVAALVALIVLDQKTTPKDDTATKTATDNTIIVGGGNSADPAATRIREEEANNLYKQGLERFGTPVKPASGTGIKGGEPQNEKRIPSSTGEEYVIHEGDTFETIAQVKYGSKSFATMIAEANPSMKPTALRVGKKIVLPAKAEKKEEPVVAKAADRIEEPVVAPRKPEPVVPLQTVGTQKIYTVQQGDTLSAISAKVYNTSRHYQKIYDANKDQIGDPNTLQVGAKLVMPDLPSKPAASNTGGPGTGVIATTIPAPVIAPPGAKMVQVSEGGSLWKIAEKFAAEKKIGIPEMMKLIVAANPDKLKDEGSLLRLGWQLIIPE